MRNLCLNELVVYGYNTPQSLFHQVCYDGFYLQMQDCGPPPKEIVGEVAPGLNFDASGNPQFPGMEQCSIM